MNAKRILFVSRAVPYANGRGVERRAALHLSYLARIGPVTLVVPLESLLDASSAGFTPDTLDVERLVIRQEATKAEVSASKYENATNLISKLWYGLQLRYWIDQTAMPSDAECHRRALGSDYHLLFAFRLSSAVWANSVYPSTSGPRTRIVDFDDIESQTHQRARMGTRRGLSRRFTDWRSQRWLKRTERKIAHSWKQVVVCSSRDASEVRKILRVDPLIIPNAVKFPDAAPQASICPIEVLFVGTLNYLPNSAGLKWFIERIWPNIFREFQNSVRFNIVGIDATPDIVQAVSVEGAHFLGRVDSVEELYVRCAVAIVPILLFGGGTRIKIIEAFSFTRAVLTTSAGCEGLGLVPERDAMVADSPEEFSLKLGALIRDCKLRTKIAEGGWRFGKAHFSIEKVRARAREQIEALAARSWE
jgi:glycosyltransferase involved in cell wall biosynthesis